MLSPVAAKRFEIIRRLGEGAMGVVYEAMDRERGGRIALKTLRTTNPEDLARLKREFRAMQDIHHENIVTLRELLNEGDRWLIAMDLVEGTDLLSHVRSETVDRPPDAPMFDERRLRAAMRQLVEGLLVLHAAGMVHRDIKPHNVMVTPQGRVVLLDFGLVADARGGASSSDLVGTPAYMAPEQAVGANVGPEADWYAVGVMLYQALVGRVPFDGTPMAVMLRKQSEVPRAPSALARGVPPDLDALALALLRLDPSARPASGEVRRRLGSASDGSPGARTNPEDWANHPASRTLTPPFIGRGEELEVLAEALRDSRKDGTAVLIQGESGVGKSRLVGRFLESVALEDPATVIVAGRCYERESVPYKAFDGVVDALARLLAHMPDEQARALLPTHVGPLVQVFPVLRRVPAVAERTRTPQGALDPFELRTRAFVGLRQLLARAGQRRPLVVVIDDAQWADHDSLALLTEIARVPEAPRMLLVLSVRAAGSGDAASSHLRTLAQAVGMPVRRLAIRSLSIEESRELAVALSDRLGGGNLTDADLDAIALEGCGHPLFVDLLTRAAEARAPRSMSERLLPSSRDGAEGAAERRQRPTSSGHLSGRGRSQLGTPRLAEALTSEMASLDPAERILLDIVAVAGAPLAQSIAERASHLTPERFAGSLRHLRIARFLVTSGARGEERLEPYHDRIRVVVVATVSEAKMRELHRRIAVALETDSNADPEALAHHWRDAGDPEQAARFSAFAGDRAAQALAFDRAAKFYEQALTLDPPAPDARRKLLVRLGDALANAGRGKRASEAFRDAASGAPAAENLELQRRAAEELMRSGHFDEGLDAIRTVLGAVGMSLPRNALWTLAFFIVLRIAVRFRGLGFTARDASEISPAELTRIDICWSVALGLSLTDTMSGAVFHLRCLLLSLRVGERGRIARALSLQVPQLATEGHASRPRALAALASAEHAAREVPGSYATAWAGVCRGTAHCLIGEFRPALVACDAALAKLRGECAGAHWEGSVAIQFAVQSLFYLGDLKELARRASSHLREALDRGDLYAAVILRSGHGSTSWLIADDPATCRSQLDAAMHEWSKAGFHLEHYYELYARTNIDLYRGAGRDALARAVDRWPALTRSLLMRVQFVRFTMWGCRARATIVAARSESGPNRKALLAAAARDLQRIARERVPWSMALAKLWSAGAESVRSSNPERIALLLRDAIAACETNDMRAFATIAKRRLGETLGGDEGAALVHDANAWLSSEGVKDPTRFTAVFAPGFGDAT